MALTEDEYRSITGEPAPEDFESCQTLAQSMVASGQHLSGHHVVTVLPFRDARLHVALHLGQCVKHRLCIITRMAALYSAVGKAYGGFQQTGARNPPPI